VTIVEGCTYRTWRRSLSLEHGASSAQCTVLCHNAASATVAETLSAIHSGLFSVTRICPEQWTTTQLSACYSALMLGSISFRTVHSRYSQTKNHNWSITNAYTDHHLYFPYLLWWPGTHKGRYGSPQSALKPSYSGMAHCTCPVYVLIVCVLMVCNAGLDMPGVWCVLMVCNAGLDRPGVWCVLMVCNAGLDRPAVWCVLMVCNAGLDRPGVWCVLMVCNAGLDRPAVWCVLMVCNAGLDRPGVWCVLKGLVLFVDSVQRSRKFHRLLDFIHPDRKAYTMQPEFRLPSKLGHSVVSVLVTSMQCVAHSHLLSNSQHSLQLKRPYSWV